MPSNQKWTILKRYAIAAVLAIVIGALVALINLTAGMIVYLALVVIIVICLAREIIR